MAQNKKVIHLGICIIGIAVLLVPLFTKNHIYQGVALGGDTKQTFLPIMISATNGVSLIDISRQVLSDSLYLGLGLTMWGVGTFNRLFHIEPSTLFYLYSILVLFVVGVTFYYLGKFVGSVRTGWILVVIGLLCSTSILALYSWGCIVNVINVYIILPWAIMLLVRWYENHKWYWFAIGIILLFCFLLFHDTGIYLPFMAIIFYFGIIAYHIKSGEIMRWWWHVPVFIIAIAGSLYLTLAWASMARFSIGITHSNYIEYLLTFIRLLFIPIPTVIGIIVVITYLINRADIEFNQVTKIVLAILGSLLLVLVGGIILRLDAIEAAPVRLALDASSIMAIITGIVLGRLLENKDLQFLKVSSYALLALGSLITLKGWLV